MHALNNQLWIDKDFFKEKAMFSQVYIDMKKNKSNLEVLKRSCHKVLETSQRYNFVGHKTPCCCVSFLEYPALNTT